MKLAEMRVAVRPGDGLVARFPGAVLVVSSAEWVGSPVVALLIEECRRPDAGSSLAERLGSLISDSDVPPPSSFCVVIDGEDGLSILARGGVNVAITGGEPVVRLGGATGTAWGACIREAPACVVIGDQSADGVVVDRRLHLEAGMVPGAGVVLLPSNASEEPAAPAPDVLATVPASPGISVEPMAAEVAEDVPAPDGSSSLLNEQAPPGPAVSSAAVIAPSAPKEPRAEPVMVWGLYCKRGHFNHPDGRYCRLCGIHMVNQRRELILGPRPVVGYLMLNDGSTYKLDTDYVLGREPDAHPCVKDGTARGLVVSDPDRTVSPVHALIHLEEWEVLVTDQRSHFGTHLWAPGKSAWERLDPDKPVPLEPRSQLLLGAQRVVFEPITKA